MKTHIFGFTPYGVPHQYFSYAFFEVHHTF